MEVELPQCTCQRDLKSSSGCLRVRQRAVVPANVGVLAGMARMACVRDGRFNTHAVEAELGDPGGMSMSKTKMPELGVSECTYMLLLRSG